MLFCLIITTTLSWWRRWTPWWSPTATSAECTYSALPLQAETFQLYKFLRGSRRQDNGYSDKSYFLDIQERVELKPMVKLIANMHGNEAVGRELMLALARYLLQNYERDPRVRKIVSETDIHIMPSLNPDGFENATKGICLGHQVGSGRHNGNSVDLNRAFPSWDNLAETKEQLMMKSEPEVAAVIDWVFTQPFVLSANFHDGAVVANYPWDDSHGPERQKSISPDDATFVSLASLYATNHANMYQGVGLCHEDNFPGGITNGAEWYIVKGGMQDFNYLFSNCMELTIEVSCCKYPLESELQTHWGHNKESLLSYLEVVQGGVRGLVKDLNGQPVPNAVVEVNGIQKNITTSYFGEYWRLLAPGKYWSVTLPLTLSILLLV